MVEYLPVTYTAKAQSKGLSKNKENKKDEREHGISLMERISKPHFNVYSMYGKDREMGTIE